CIELRVRRRIQTLTSCPEQNASRRIKDKELQRKPTRELVEQPSSADLPVKYFRRVFPTLIQQHCIANGTRSMNDTSQWRHVILDLIVYKLHTVPRSRVCLENSDRNAEAFELANAVYRKRIGRPATS